MEKIRINELIALFLAALSTLLFEITITKVFGYIGWKNYAYMVISTATLASADSDKLLAQAYQETAAGNLDQALTTLQLAVKDDPNSSLARTRLAGVRILRQEYSASIKDFQQAIMLDNNNALAFIGMSMAYLHMGQYNMAKAALNEAARIDPTKQPEIDKVLAGIKQRADSTTTVH